MPVVEYEPGRHFPGVVGRTADESSPAWPVPKRAPKGTPNVLFIVLDDTGFGQLGCFGSPIDTPNLDALAANGLRYNNMHTTALCSPSRSCIVTGRNHHSNDMACVTEFATGFPGYDGNVPFENGFLSEILLAQGYNTYMVGKWHLIPASQESGGRALRPLAVGPRLRALLRVPRRRHEPVESRPRLRQPSGRAARDSRGGLPPHARPRRQGDAVHRRRQAGRPRQAVLPALLPGRDPRAAPRAEGVGRQVRGEVRRRVGRLPHAHVRPSEGARHRAGRLRAVPPRPRRAGLGFAVGRSTPPLRARDGGVRRFPQPHRPPHRPPHRVPAHDRRARQHVDHGGLRQRRERRRRRHRHDQRGAVLQQLPRDRSRTASRSSTSSAARSTSTTTRGAGPSPGTRRSAGGSARPTAAARATRSSCTGRRGSRRAARCARSTRTSSTWCRPCSTCSASRRPPRSRVFRSHRSRV